MSKLKTHKSTSKRFKLTRGKKILRRRAGQDHFNSRDAGTATMRKRRDTVAAKADSKNIRTLLPYS